MSKILSLEIGQSLVRGAEVEKAGSTTRVSNMFVFEMPEDAARDGKIRVSNEVVAAFRAELRKRHIKAKDVSFAVESTRILYKQLEIPEVPLKLVQETLNLSFSDHFPAVDETLYHISYIIENKVVKNGKTMMRLDAFAVPNDLSESYYNFAIALGMNIKSLCDSSHCNVTIFQSELRNTNSIVIGLNETTTSFAIVTHGDMIYSKTIPCGISEACDLVKGYMTKHQAAGANPVDGIAVLKELYTKPLLQRYMPNSSVGATEEEQLKNSVTLALAPILQGIESNVSAFLAKQNLALNELVVTGFGAGMYGISPLLSSVFKLSVKVVQSSPNVVYSNQALKTDPLLLAALNITGTAIDLSNLLTTVERQGGARAVQRRIDRLFVLGGLTIAITACAIGGVKWMKAWEKNLATQKTQQTLEQQIQVLQEAGAQEAYDTYSDVLSYNTEVHNLYNNTMSGNEDITTFLEELESDLPESAYVMAMTLSPSAATATVWCENKYVAAGVLNKLRNMDSITAMDCPGVYEAEQDKEALMFQASFTLKSTADREAEKEAGNTGSDDMTEIPEEIYNADSLEIQPNENMPEDMQPGGEQESVEETGEVEETNSEAEDEAETEANAALSELEGGEQ